MCKATQDAQNRERDATDIEPASFDHQKYILRSSSVIREPGKIEFTVRNSNIGKIGTRDKSENKLQEYINRRSPRLLEKSTESKISSHIKDFTRTQKVDRKMKKLQARKCKLNIWQNTEHCSCNASTNAQSTS